MEKWVARGILFINTCDNGKISLGAANEISAASVRVPIPTLPTHENNLYVYTLYLAFPRRLSTSVFVESQR